MATKSDLVDAFLTICSALDDGDLLALSTSRSADEAAARETALARARATARRLRRIDELERMQSALLRWADAGGAYSGVYAPVSPVHDLLLADLRHQALPALSDAGIALLLGEALDADARRVLLAPWSGVHQARRDRPRPRRARRRATAAG